MISKNDNSYLDITIPEEANFYAFLKYVFFFLEKDSHAFLKLKREKNLE